MTIDLAAAVRPEPKRDRWGRYLITPASGGKARGYTRATTWAKTMADSYGLEQWGKRMVALGLVHRPDLLALVAAHPDDKDTLNRACADAVEAAKASAGANMGTALHAMTERVDLGLEVPDGPWTPDVDAYRTVTRAAGLTLDDTHIERVVVLDALEVAGTFDRIVTVDGRRYIADLKTAQALDYAWGEIAIQLALYAHADAIYDYATERREPMPQVDRDRALVIHLPAGQGRCELHWVDIAAGWQAAELAGAVRVWRKRKSLAVPFTRPGAQPSGVASSPAPTPVSTASSAPAEGGAVGRLTIDRLLARVERLKAAGCTPEQFAAAWPVGTAGPKRADEWIDDQLPAIDAALTRLEAAGGLPFDELDMAPEPMYPFDGLTPLRQTAPTVLVRDVPEEGPTVPLEDVQAVQRSGQALDGEAKSFLAMALGDMTRHGLRLELNERPTTRRWNVARAAVALARWVGAGATEDEARELTVAVLGMDDQPSIPTGCLLAALEIDEAAQLATLADGLAGGRALAYDDEGRPGLAPAA
jgi:hypothetical protein